MKNNVLIIIAMVVVALASCTKNNGNNNDPQNPNDTTGNTTTELRDYLVSWIVADGPDSIDAHSGATKHAPATVDAMTGATSTDPDTIGGNGTNEGVEFILKQMKKAVKENYTLASDQSILLKQQTASQAQAAFSDICTRGNNKIMHKDEISQGTAEHCTNILIIYCTNDGQQVCPPYYGYYTYTPEEDDD